MNKYLKIRNNVSHSGIIKAEDETVIPYINFGETYSKEAEKKKEQNYRDRIRNIMNRGNVEIIDVESPEGEAEELIIKPDQDRSWAEQFRLQIPSEKTTQNGEYIKTGSRSDRNNNPLNIRFTSIPWEGKITKGKSDNDFEEFETRDYGWRAAYRNINTKIVRDKLNTIRKLINVWAPKNENNTEQYIQHVTELTGIDPDETINPNDINTIPKIAAAMAAIEAGKQEVDLDDALRGFKFYLS